MNILVSACLLGNPCRYDGEGRPNERVIALSQEHRLIPVCPEVAGGLSVPRAPCEIVGERVISNKGKDCTKEYTKGAEIALKLAQKYGCKYAVLKHKSPSCSNKGIYDGSFTRTLNEQGQAVTAALLSKNGITVLNENELALLEGEKA